MPKQYDINNNGGGDNIMTMMGNSNNNNNNTHHHDERLLHSPTMFTATNNITTTHDNITDGWTNYTPHRHQTNQNRMYNTNNSHQTNAAKKLPLRISGRKFTVANTNYNTDMLGGDDAFNNRNRDNNNNRNNNVNATDNYNNMMRMEHRDSILGISGKFHPLQEDVELLNFNHRRGSMGSLSEGLNAGGNANNMDGPLLMNDDCDLLANGGGDGTSNNNKAAGNASIDNAGIINNNANGNTGTNNNNTQTKATHHRPVTNTNYNDPSFHQEEQQIQYLAARARRAQMIAVQESRKLEENLRRLEMRRMMMVRERLQRERLQQQQQQGGSQQANQQQQQGNQNEQQQPQRQGNQNNNRTGQIPRKVNETNYKTMNPTAPPSPAHDVQTNMNYGQTNNPTQMMMAQHQHNQQQQQQQFNTQFQNNQMMNQSNQMGVHNAMNVPYFNQAQQHNMNGYTPTMPPVPAAAQKNNGGSKTATVPNNNSNAKKAQTHQPSQTTPTPIPSAPRRPLSAYNIFFSEIRNELLKESDDNDGEAANNDDDDDNADDNANDAATKENNEQTTNEPTDKPTQDNVTTTTNNTTTDKNKQFETFAKNLAQTRLTTNPKKRIHRKTHGKIQFVSLAKLVGQKWRALPDVQRKKYQDLAMVDKARYKREKMEVVEALRVEAKRLRKIERDRVLLNM